MSSSYLVYLNIKHLTMKKLIDYFYTILLISSFFILDRLPLYMTGGESHSVRYMRATTKPLVRATSSDKRASPYRLAS